ncbi:TolC family protein [Alloalcanivorax xenomutans]|uniref:TolC family protein n=1 Tax=Alcanivoracaceae TaxID=224372 RepID=UPI00105DF0EE|nr:TolC family protein [Alcanivorax sp. 24]
MKSRTPGWRLAVSAMLCLAVPGLLIADTPAVSPGTALPLQAVLTLALEQNPGLTAYPYRLRAADAAVLQSGLRPQPELSLEVENIAGKAPLNGVEGAQITVALSQLIELGNKRESRNDVASRALDTEQQGYAIARLEVLGEAVTRYIALARHEEELALAKRTLALAEKAEGAARRRVRAGAAPEADLTRMTLATRHADIAFRRAQMERRRASQQLAALWGQQGADQLHPATALRPLPTLAPLDEIMNRLEHAPDLLRLASETRLHGAQSRLASARGSRDVTVSVGARHDREGDNNTLVLGVSVPLNLKNPNRGNIARAESQLAASEARLRARRIELMATLESLYRSLELLREELALIEETALPLARQLYAGIESGYRTGRYSLLELINAQQEQLTLEHRAIDLAAQFHLQRNELERLTGLPFSRVGNQEDTP